MWCLWHRRIFLQSSPHFGFFVCTVLSQTKDSTYNKGFIPDYRCICAKKIGNFDIKRPFWPIRNEHLTNKNVALDDHTGKTTWNWTTTRYISCSQGLISCTLVYRNKDTGRTICIVFNSYIVLSSGPQWKSVSFSRVFSDFWPTKPRKTEDNKARLLDLPSGRLPAIEPAVVKNDSCSLSLAKRGLETNPLRTEMIKRFGFNETTWVKRGL